MRPDNRNRGNNRQITPDGPVRNGGTQGSRVAKRCSRILDRMADLTLLPEETHPRVNLADWMIRLGVAIVFLIAGAEKFSATNPNSHWVSMFNQIGLGEWFRYFTAVVEVLGAALIL